MSQGSGWVYLGYDVQARTAELSASTVETNRGFDSPSVYPLLAIDMYEHACGLDHETAPVEL
jgi:superoxide dismutase